MRVAVVSDSFTTIKIKLKEELGGNPAEKSPPEEGKDIHNNLSEHIKNRTRNGAEGQLLSEIEATFECEFFQAEVGICGYCTKTSEKDFYSGRMDALAFRHSEEGDLEVFVVEWKTYSKVDLNKWWEKAKYFQQPLYQCLLYRELLQAHLKVNAITARVGIILVPIHRARRPKVRPGLCEDVGKLDKEGLLDKLKEYQWFSEQSSCVHTVTLPSNLFTNLDGRYVEGTNVLKQEILVKEIIKDDATVAHLCQELGLLQLQVNADQTHEERSEAEGTRNEKSKDETKKKGGLLSNFRKGKRK